MYVLGTIVSMGLAFWLGLVIGSVLGVLAVPLIAIGLIVVIGLGITAPRSS